MVFGSIGAVAATTGALAWLWRLGGGAADDRREVALAGLVASQRQQWTAEQAARRVRDPWPLNVRWVSTARAQAVMAMRRHRTYDFAWWQVSELRPAPVAQFLSFAFAVVVALSVVVSAFAQSSLFSLDGKSPSVGTVMVFTGAWAGILLGFGRLIFTDRQHPRRLSGRSMRTMSLLIGLPPLLVGTLIGYPGAGLALAVSAGSVAALGSGAVTASLASGPTVLLRADRTAALVSGATLGSATLLLASGVAWPDSPLPWIEGLMAATAAVLLSAWGQLQLAQLVIAARHRTPLRQARALEDACERGVLRRAGDTYQFRHGLLRDRLSRA